MARTKTVVLDPDTWIRGAGAGVSKLYRAEDGKQCCLGFACTAYGVPKVRMSGRGELQDVRGLPRELRFSHSLGQTLKRSIWGVYVANDRGPSSDQTRVDRINRVLVAISAPFRFRLKKSRRAVAGTRTKAKRAVAPSASAAQKG